MCQTQNIIMYMNHNDNIKQRFGNKIKYYRKLKNLTQSQLADKIGKTIETVSNIERGINSTKIEVMFQLSNALSIHIKDLFDDQDINPYLDKVKINLIQDIKNNLEKRSNKYLKNLAFVLKEK